MIDDCCGDGVLSPPPPVFPAAVMLYDTRLWAGGSTLPNLGTGGSLYDMTVGTYSGSAIQFARNQIAGAAYTWAQWGGNADTAGWIAVFAIGNIKRGSGVGIIEGDMIMNNSHLSSNGQYHSIVNFLGSNINWVSDDDIFASIFRNDPSYSSPNAFEIDWSIPGTGSTGYTMTDNARTLVIVSFDPLTGTQGIFVNGIEITNNRVYPDAGPFPMTNTSPAIDDIFMYLGESQPAVASGKWTYGVYAQALYRGIKPNAAFLTALQSSFGEPVPIGQAQLTFVGSAAQADDTGYHALPITVQLPVGVDGDIRFAVVCGFTNAEPLVIPTGWRQIMYGLTPDGNNYMYVFWRMKQFGDANTVIVHGAGGDLDTACTWHAMGYAFRGHDANAPINALTSRATATAVAITPRTSTTTTPCTMIAFTSSASGGGSFSTATAGWTEIQDGQSNTTVLGPHAAYVKAAPTHGDQPSITVTPSGTSGPTMICVVGVRLAAISPPPVPQQRSHVFGIHTGTTFAVTRPTGTLATDLLVLGFQLAAGDTVAPTISGWTRISAPNNDIGLVYRRYALYTRVADMTATDTPTVTLADGSVSGGWTVAAISGGLTGGSDVTFSTNGGGGTVVSTSKTPDAYALVINFYMSYSAAGPYITSSDGFMPVFSEITNIPYTSNLATKVVEVGQASGVSQINTASGNEHNVYSVVLT